MTASCDFLPEHVNFRDKLDSSFHVTVLRNKRRCPKSHRVTKKLSQQFRDCFVGAKLLSTLCHSREVKRRHSNWNIFNDTLAEYYRGSDVEILRDFIFLFKPDFISAEVQLLILLVDKINTECSAINYRRFCLIRKVFNIAKIA